MTFGQPKGYVFIKEKIEHSRSPGQNLLFHDYNVEEDYFNALQMRLVPVMDVAVDGSSYLVLGEGEKSGTFIWDIDKKDTTGEMIPYKLLHPGRDWEDILEMLGRMRKGGLTAEDSEWLHREAERVATELGHIQQK